MTKTYKGLASEHNIAAMDRLCHWLDGFEAAGNGKIVGHWELVMFLRTLEEVKKDGEHQLSEGRSV